MRSCQILGLALALVGALGSVQPVAAAPGHPAEVTCGAPLPARGATFEGTVLHVPDGQSLCVADGPSPAQWVRVTLANGRADTPRRDLMSATFAKRVTCRAVGRGLDSVLAECAVEGIPLTSVLQRPSVRLAAFFWR